MPRNIDSFSRNFPFGVRQKSCSKYFWKIMRKKSATECNGFLILFANFLIFFFYLRRRGFPGNPPNIFRAAISQKTFRLLLLIWGFQAKQR